MMKKLLSFHAKQNSVHSVGTKVKTLFTTYSWQTYVIPVVRQRANLFTSPARFLVSPSGFPISATSKTNKTNNTSVSDRFGALAEAEDSAKPVVHKSLEGRIRHSSSMNAIDSGLLDPLEEPETARRTIRLRPQRSNERLTWNARQIMIQCNKGDLDAALKAFLEGALETDRVIPPRYLVHRLLGALAKAGRSADAFQVYRKMKEIGMPLTQATYSRLFRACAEDCCVWQRENEHLFPSLSAGPYLSSLQRRRNQLMEKALCTDELIQRFGGSGLRRAQGLWKRLHSNQISLTPITANALLLALAKGGDLSGCFEALDSLLSPKTRSSSRNNVHSTFQPDSYTVTALLSAVRPASLLRHLTAVTSSQTAPSSSMTALELSLSVWHRLLPYMTTSQWGPQCFVSLIEASRSDYGNACKSTNRLLLFHPPTGLQTTKVTVTSKECENLLNQPFTNEILLLNHPLQITQSGTSDSVDSRSMAVTSQRTSILSSLEPVPEFDRPMQLWHPDWSDAKLSLKSPVNLLLSAENAILIVPPVDGWLPWHRLTLLGGLHGFLNSVEENFRSTVTVQLLTALISMFPKPQLSSENSQLDQWECELIQAAKSRNIHLDMGFFNSLINRRTASGFSGSPLLSEATQLGLIPDLATWGSLAKGCKTIDSIDHLLAGFAKASQAKSIRSILPSRTFLGTLMTASRFNWPVKAYLLRLMMDSDAGGDSSDATGNTFCGLQPDRRLVAQLEVDISLFRHWLRKGIIPKDGSAVPPSSITQGVAIPPHAASTFRQFLPVYRKWLSMHYSK